MNDVQPISVRDQMLVLERYMSTLEQVEIVPIHRLANGMYAREIRVPKGVTIAGKVHSTETFGIMAKGSMIIIGEDGTKTVVDAPYVHIGKVGYKRVGYAIEDVVWVTIHRTDLTDLEEIEKEQFIVGEVDMFDFITGKVRSLTLDQHDFRRMLVEYGFTPEEVRAQSESESDRVDVDLTQYDVEIRKSGIEGVGVFSTKTFNAGDLVGPSRINGMRTQLGRYINHSHNPNARMVFIFGGDVAVQIIRSIGIEEITTDYRQTLTLFDIAPTVGGGVECPE